MLAKPMAGYEAVLAERNALASRVAELEGAGGVRKGAGKGR